jgi:hypothetical protein
LVEDSFFGGAAGSPKKRIVDADGNESGNEID